jgi:hypothetical protein
MRWKYYFSEHYPSSCFHSKHKVSDTGFCLHLQVKPTQLGPTNRDSPTSEQIYQSQSQIYVTTYGQ